MTSVTNSDCCQHDSYCPLRENACIKGDFKAICRLKSAPLSELHLLAKVKEQIERLRRRG